MGNKLSRVQIGTETDWQAVAAEIGDGTRGNKDFPVRVGTETDWQAVAAGVSHTVALKTDGSLWAWGYNWSGQVGDGTTDNNRINPVQIGTETDWQAVAVGWYHTVALKTDGSLWAWGDNDYGELGDGTTESKSSPVRIGTGTDWQAVTAGSDHTVALKMDGSLWAWGDNDYGQLGDGTTGSKSSPVRIGTATDWQAVAARASHTVALKKDSSFSTGFSLWAWGVNSATCDLNSATGSSRPVRIGTETDWQVIAAGSDHTVALKTDSSLWAWGINWYGQLGNGTKDENISCPMQVGAGWQTVAGGGRHTVALKTDGTLWAWGDNYYGQLGDGTAWQESPALIIGTDVPDSTGASFLPAVYQLLLRKK
jgi:alpha-tubulin suppressor-like RCC1 family protein